MNSESTWLKRDPSNGCLIGPDGCHYENEHQACHYALLKLCGCGDPEEAYNFCRAVLMAFDRRPIGEREWIDAEDAVRDLISAKPDIAAHVMGHLLTNLKFLEHGGNVGGSWLTLDGERIVDLGPITEELLEDEGALPA